MKIDKARGIARRLAEHFTGDEKDAIKSLISYRGLIKAAIERTAKEHPYKVYGDADSYSPYNEGWTDALDRLESIIDSI